MFTDRLLQALARAGHVAVLTGAGISAESGIPTFRDPEGLWSKFRPEELANFDAFIRNPDLVWQWYSHRRSIMAHTTPNPGHFALAELASIVPRLTLITQNVDNLHARAGSRDVLELHGNIEHSFCIDCHRPYTDVEAPPSELAIRCPCGGLIRPDVVWFGEALPADILRQAWSAAEDCSVFLTIGTSGEVYPAAQLPSVAREHGAYVAEINPGPTAISHRMHECIQGASGAVLPVLVQQLRILTMTG